MKPAHEKCPGAHRLRGCARAGVALAALITIPPVGAQALPRAGDVLRESAPPTRVLPGTETAPLLPEPVPAATAPAGGPTFALRAVRFNGNTVFASDRLQAEVARGWARR